MSPKEIVSIDTVVNKGLQFLLAEQHLDGSFSNVSSPHKDHFDNGITYVSPFTTALICLALSTSRERESVREMSEKSINFLLSQKSTHWSFNYWSKESVESKTMPYPDDLDVTFCALAALYIQKESTITGETLAKVVSLLTTTEENEGGPYRTWILPRNAKKIWRDVDVAVNSNIGYFLSLQGIDLPNLNTFIESKIDEGNLISPYYPSLYPIVYFISRFYNGPKTPTLQNLILSKRNKLGYWENPLNSALAISALLHLGYDAKKLKTSIRYLLNQKGKYNQPYAFGIDPARDGKPWYAASAPLTMALCLEALGKYMLVAKETPQKKRISGVQQALHQQIVQHVEKKFFHLGKEIYQSVSSEIQELVDADTGKTISLLPYYFRSAIGKKGSHIPDAMIKKLGVANLFGWLAYTIYDDFLDQEGDPRKLSAATISLRELTSIFRDILPDNAGFQKFFTQTMDQIDYANTWETTYCRIPARQEAMRTYPLPNYGTYSTLAKKSLGHALGPICLLFALGYTQHSSEVRYLSSFFHHYLIARQLNDDAHDFEIDIKKGHINPVCSLLLKKWRLKHTAENSKEAVIEKLQELFWQDVVDDVSLLIQTHVAKAKHALTKNTCIEQPDILLSLLYPIEKAVEKTLSERKKALEFIDTFNQPQPL